MLQRREDVLDPARANALAATLVIERVFATDDALPAFFHQIYFWDAQPPDLLGRDGHPQVGGLIPDTGLPRRMWAGGKLVFHAPLRAGNLARKTSLCESVVPKQGRSGPLALVRLRHELWQDDVLCVTEWQDLIYREDWNGTALPRLTVKAEENADSMRSAGFSPTLLFRYSALTFNGHRIHYDLPYAKTVEGYGGLVVHGPLLAQLLILMAEEELGSLAAFRFRATAPVMHDEAVTLCRSGGRLWVRGPDGRQCMTAQARPISE
ncbi:MAG: acyl dehydratase [Roseobacter sp.]|nr:acyl dehydratase [Roseobacter sp.]